MGMQNQQQMMENQRTGGLQAKIVIHTVSKANYCFFKHSAHQVFFFHLEGVNSLPHTTFNWP